MCPLSFIGRTYPGSSLLWCTSSVETSTAHRASLTLWGMCIKRLCLFIPFVSRWVGHVASTSRFRAEASFRFSLEQSATRHLLQIIPEPIWSEFKFCEGGVMVNIRHVRRTHLHLRSHFKSHGPLPGTSKVHLIKWLVMHALLQGWMCCVSREADVFCEPWLYPSISLWSLSRLSSSVGRFWPLTSGIVNPSDVCPVVKIPVDELCWQRVWHRQPCSRSKSPQSPWLPRCRWLWTSASGRFC